MWLDGKSQWVARWRDQSNELQEVIVRVARHKRKRHSPGLKEALSPDEFAARWEKAKESCIHKAEALGSPEFGLA